MNRELVLGLGVLGVTLGSALNRFAGQGNIIDFLCGLFYGVSLVLTIYYLVTIKKPERN